MGWALGLATVLLLASVTPAVAQPSTASPALVQSASTLTAHLRIGPPTMTLTRAFFGINGETVTPSAFVSVPRLESFMNDSGIGMVRYSAGEDTCNITTDTSWTPGVLGGIATPGCGYDIPAFAQWCLSQTPHCQSDVGLPGEANNSAEDAYYAQYIVKTLGFQPTYWSIGNEPISWTHYGIPWSQWKLTDHSAPTGIAYAIDVRNAISAVKKVDPAARFVGIQSYWCPDTTYTDPVASIDGNQISAIACHVYTNDGVSNPTTAQYFASLMSSHNITTNYLTLRNHLKGLCSSCATLPIQIGEYQGGPVGTPAPQDRHYDGAIWLAASLVQALDVGIPSVQVFELQGTVGCQFCLLGATDYPDAQGLLYTDVLTDLHRGHPVHNVTVRSSITNLWATVDHSRISNDSQLLFVNANLSQTASFPLTSRYYTPGEPGFIVSWNNSARAPTLTSYHALPRRLSVPPLSLALVAVTPAASPSGHHPLPVHHLRGVPAPTETLGILSPTSVAAPTVVLTMTGAGGGAAAAVPAIRSRAALPTSG